MGVVHQRSVMACAPSNNSAMTMAATVTMRVKQMCVKKGTLLQKDPA
jgi:hypothetical protein